MLSLVAGWFDRKRMGRLGQLHRFSFASIWERAGCPGSRRILGPRWIYFRWRRGFFQATSICWVEARPNLHDGNHGCFDCNELDEFEMNCILFWHQDKRLIVAFGHLLDRCCVSVLCSEYHGFWSWNQKFLCHGNWAQLNLWIHSSYQGYITPEITGKLSRTQHADAE